MSSSGLGIDHPTVGSLGEDSDCPEREIWLRGFAQSIPCIVPIADVALPFAKRPSQLSTKAAA